MNIAQNAPVIPGGLAGQNNGFPSNVPVWIKFNLLVSAVGIISVTDPLGNIVNTTLPAGLTQDIVLFELPQDGFVHASRFKTVIAATGVTTLTAKLGVAGADTVFISTAFDVKAAASATNFAPTTTTGNGVANNTTAVINLVVLLTSTVDNLSVLATGSLDVWVLVSKLP